MAVGKKKVWRKILYENQGFPDNYVDKSFLEEVQKNLYTRHYEFWPTVLDSGAITQQLCSVCLFVVLFIYMDEQWLNPTTVVTWSSCLSLIGYICHEIIDRYDCNKGETEKRSWLFDLRTVAIFVTFSYVLSPVLVTLTETISTDTIYAMTTAMLAANLVFHDYTPRSPVSGPVSLNAGIFASVCLASRLHTSWHAFALVTLAFEMFALLPKLRKKIQNVIPVSRSIITTSASLLTLAAIMTISTVTAVMVTMAIIFITFICPAWLIKLQPWKNNIHGPWDEAVIRDIT